MKKETTTNRSIRSIELHEMIQNLHNKTFGLTCYIPFDTLLSLEIQVVCGEYHICINGEKMFVKEHLYITCEKHDGEMHLQFFDHCFDFSTLLFVQDEQLTFATGYSVRISDTPIPKFDAYASFVNEVFNLDDTYKSDQPEKERLLNQ